MPVGAQVWVETMADALDAIAGRRGWIISDGKAGHEAQAPGVRGERMIPVEPLPVTSPKDVKQAEARVTWPCAICGGAVTVEVKAECGFGCGRVFHQGCYTAKNALGDGRSCAVCGFVPAAT